MNPSAAMPPASPWAAAIAQLATRRAPAARAIDTTPAACRKRGVQAVVAARRTQATRARILATLAGGPSDGMSADAIAIAMTGKKASGNIYRHLAAMAAAGDLEKHRINNRIVLWTKK